MDSAIANRQALAGGVEVKIIFMMKAGIIEWEVPPALADTFVFTQMATQVHMAGYFMVENLYIRHSEMIGISIATDGPVMKPMHGGTLQ